MIGQWWRRRQIQSIQARIADLEKQSAIIDGDIMTKADETAIKNRESELERLREKLEELEDAEIQNHDHQN